MQAVAVGHYFPTLSLGNGYCWIIIGPAQPLVSTVVGLTHKWPAVKEWACGPAWSLVSAMVGPSPKQPALKEWQLSGLAQRLVSAVVCPPPTSDQLSRDDS